MTILLINVEITILSIFISRSINVDFFFISQKKYQAILVLILFCLSELFPRWLECVWFYNCTWKLAGFHFFKNNGKYYELTLSILFYVKLFSKFAKLSNLGFLILSTRYFNWRQWRSQSCEERFIRESINILPMAKSNWIFRERRIIYTISLFFISILFRLAQPSLLIQACFAYFERPA